ncbi:MAG: hypothetical protein ACRDY7_04055 [Acidimicrobiia bacterium]
MRRMRDERGEATTELALWYHASHVAEAAAQEGARAARAFGGSAEAWPGPSTSTATCR